MENTKYLGREGLLDDSKPLTSELIINKLTNGENGKMTYADYLEQYPHIKEVISRLKEKTDFELPKILEQPEVKDDKEVNWKD